MTNAPLAILMDRFKLMEIHSLNVNHVLKNMVSFVQTVLNPNVSNANRVKLSQKVFVMIVLTYMMAVKRVIQQVLLHARRVIS